MTLLLHALAMAAALTPTAPDVRLDPARVAALPQIEAAFDAHGEHHVCRGASLAALLASLGAPSGEALRGRALTGGVLIRAADGYAVLFSFGELDDSLGHAGAIVASHCDGKPLDASAGPLRLIVPADRRPARDVRGVASLEFVALAPAAR